MTVKEFQRLIAQEKFDVKSVQVYLRKQGVGCWQAMSVTIEDSGIYIEAGEESNPQTVDAEIIEDDLSPQEYKEIQEGSRGSE